jgi:hypothetical protein
LTAGRPPGAFCIGVMAAYSILSSLTEATCEEASSGQRHSHDVLSYWKAADKHDGSVLHGGVHSCLLAPVSVLDIRFG